MSNLKEIRTRIASVKSTRKITNAMKMVAASRLKRAQDAVINLRPYMGKLHEILLSLAKSLKYEEITSNYLKNNGTAEKVLLVIITSNKGLCGAFNSNVINKSLELANSKYSEQYNKGNLYFFPVGKKGADFFNSKGYPVYDYNNVIQDELTFNNAVPIIREVMDAFHNGEFDRVDLVYNKFKNAAVQILTVDQFLPVDLDVEEEMESTHYNFIFEPSKKQIIQELIPKSLRIQFYEALLESLAAEHGARMTAMHKATDNATELIKDLQLTYNKARQASITNEILEVVSGAEALRE
jgi:F-type H+-transporting ATPase subunit gamma